MIRRQTYRVIRRASLPIERDAHPHPPKPPPRPPAGALELLHAWEEAREGKHHERAAAVLAELEELAASPRTKTDDSKAGPGRYAASRVEGVEFILRGHGWSWEVKPPGRGPGFEARARDGTPAGCPSDRPQHR